MNRYRMRRLKMRMSQWRLAQLSGVPQSRISLFENGLVKLRDIDVARIRDVLGMRPGKR